MSSPRDQILARVRDALAPLPARAALPEWDREVVVLRQARGLVDPWPLFAERLKGVNGTPLTSAAELVALLAKHNWKHGYCDPALWPQLQAAFPADFVVETEFDRKRVDDYAFGITAADGAIAETGTLILTDNGTSRRLGALAPWVHVAVLKRAQIHHDIPAAVSALPADPNVIWCTGPSKTADVEGILIEGVHGPGMQVALLVD
ncbi:MAG TPA: LUD domain-containing protein [Lacunisphaera sp.]|nr:LUD domain-containing protein [Lacunisphaera sp.]